MRRTALLYIALVALYAAVPAHAQQTVGLFLNDEDSFEGYTLFAPMASTDTFLIDNEGRLINSWTSASRARLSAIPPVHDTVQPHSWGSVNWRGWLRDLGVT